MMLKIRLILAIIGVTCGHSMAAETPSISLADAASLNINVASIVDVRYAGDYRRGHIKDAISLPYYRLDKIDLPKDRPIVTYCSGIGCSLSMDAAAKLQAMGYTNVRYLLGGISDVNVPWKQPVIGPRPSLFNSKLSGGGKGGGTEWAKDWQWPK